MFMRVLISDCAKFNDLISLAEEFNVGVEVQEYTTPDFVDNKQDFANEVAGRIKNIPLRGFHGPFWDMAPASRDKKIQELTLQRFETGYNLAKTIGATHMVLHTGYIPKTYPRKEWIDNSLKFWKDFLSDKNDSIAIHIENVYDDDSSMIIELLDKINNSLQREAVSACLDLGHVHANSSKPHEHWIKTMGDRIKYVHAHNNGGILDDHWGLWKGTIDMPRVFDLLLKYSQNSFWMIEARQPDVYKSLTWAKENGYLDV
jgi:sugar phosphate isomerase/epimerase